MADLTDQLLVGAREGGELRLEFEDDWAMGQSRVRAAPYLQTGRPEPPANTWELESTVRDDTLVVPVGLSASRWVVRVDTTATKADRRFGASHYFVVDVRP